MNNTILIIASAIALPLVGLSLWAWIAAKQMQKTLSAGFEGIHLED